MSDKIVTIGEVQHELEIEHKGSTFRAGDQAVEVVAVRGTEAEIRVGERSYIVPFVVQGTQVSFSFDGEIYTADVADKGSRARARHRDHSMSAPMPGIVLKILAEVGAAVEKGAPLVILEAMKMEHQINAPRAGTVTAINCREGELVQPGVELITLNDEG